LFPEEQVIALLKHDLNNRVLELQRERGLTERLQKQLEDRAKQQEELKVILSKQQENTTAILEGHEDIIEEALNVGADRGTKYAYLRTCKAFANFIGWMNA
jgi:hypothetical protein